MRITTILTPQAVRERLISLSKEEVIEELVDSLLWSDKGSQREEAIKALLTREKLGSTGMGKGVAIPHGKVQGVKGVFCAFGRSLKGVDFGAEDGRPVHLFFLLLGPEQEARTHLKALAKIAQMMKDEPFKKSLMEAKSREEIYRLIKEKDEEVSQV